jgi:alpha-amylase
MNKKILFRKTLLLYVMLLSMLGVKAQTLDVKDDVMLQGFYWDSYQNASIIAEGGLYNYLKARVPQYASAKFDVIWLPPPSKGNGMAYFQTELYSFNNSHGNEAQLRSLMADVKTNGMHGMADIVINHRSGTTAWADFTNPVWDCSVLAEDGDVKGVAGQIQPCSGKNDEGEHFSGSRDILHSNLTVQADIKAYLTKLQDIGFDSWRYDFVKGYPAKYVGFYNAASAPYTTVGEFWDGNLGLVTGWVDASGSTLTGTTTKSTAFDFPLYYKLKDALNGAYSNLNSNGHMPGLAGTFGYSDKAITFTENHDVHDIVGNDKLMKANAYILTHPGIPMVFLTHYEANQTKINELIAVRKTNGINANSSIVISNSSTYYTAIIDNKVAVRIGPNTTWTPGTTGWIQNTSGTEYVVWSKATISVAPSIAITPVGGSFVAGTTQAVTIAATDDKAGSIVYYTTDGTTPTSSSAVYSAPISVSTTTTVKAIAKDVDGLFSGVVSQTYTFLAVGDITVRFLPPASWVIPINVHHWNAIPLANLANSTWPGKAMTGPDANGYYSYTFSNIASTNILFDAGTGSPQTTDINGVNKNTCYNMSSGTLVEETCPNLGIDTPEIETNKVSLYPVPVLDSFKINAIVSNVFIYDINGRIVKQEKGVIEANTAIEISNLKKGIYFLTANDANGSSFTRKFIKE